MRISVSRSAAGAALAAGVLAVAACGGSGGSGSSTGASSGGGSANVARARSIIAPYVGHPSRFPITTPLKKRPPRGARIAYMDCGTAVCGLFYALAQPAVKPLGMTITRFNAGVSAKSVDAAFGSVLQGDFDGVFVPAIQPTLWQNALEQLHAKGIPVVTTGVTGGDKSKIAVMQFSERLDARMGKLLAAWVVAHNGDKTNAVFYNVPELPFIKLVEQGFVQSVHDLCSACEVRTADIPAASLGSTAPGKVVDDLQAHPDTKTAVFGTSEITQGLPAALKTAGLDVQTLGNAGDPATLQRVASGEIDATLTVDFPVVTWTLIDSLARAMTGQPIAPGAKTDAPPAEFIDRAAMRGVDASKGWTGYPDFPQRFMKLWGVSGG